MQILDHLLVKDRLDIELHGKETNGPHLMIASSLKKIECWDEKPKNNPVIA